ncbi:MAG: hypothetical protein K2Q18_01050, partial [Bdellovibrionales bacterium]|nr:hypothetical protein [Bdellovibrionales bacterium]
VFFMIMSVALFSCENHQVSHDTTDNAGSSIQRKPESRHPAEPNDSSSEEQGRPKSKKTRKYTARSSNWC